MKLIEVLHTLVHTERFSFAVVEPNGELAFLGIHFLDGARALVYFDLINGLRLVVLLLGNGAGPRTEQE